MGREYATSGLVKHKTGAKTTKDGKKAGGKLVWRGFVRYRDSKDDEWKQLSRILTDEKGEHIPARSGDDDRGRDTAKRAQLRWIKELEEADREAERAAQKEAELAAAEAEAIAAESDIKNMLVSAYAQNYVNMLTAKQAAEPSTIRAYLSSVKRIREGMPDVTMGALTPSIIDDWESWLLNECLLSGTTTAKHHRFLRLILKHALERDELDRDPMRGVKPPKRNDPSPNALSRDASAKLYEELYAKPRTAVVTAACIALFTGMRQGEVCGLRWKDVDIDPATKSGSLRVTRSIGNGTGGTYTKAPKSKASRRVIPVPEELGRVLLERKEAMRKQLANMNIYSQDALEELYVIGNAEGGFKGPRALGGEWHTMAEDLQLIGSKGRLATFHDLRHTFATLAIASGADVKSVAAILGHSDPALVLRVYADADPNAKRAASNAVADAIKSTTPKNVVQFPHAVNE